MMRIDLLVLTLILIAPSMVVQGQNRFEPARSLFLYPEAKVSQTTMRLDSGNVYIGYLGDKKGDYVAVTDTLNRFLGFASANLVFKYAPGFGASKESLTLIDDVQDSYLDSYVGSEAWLRIPVIRVRRAKNSDDAIANLLTGLSDRMFKIVPTTVYASGVVRYRTENDDFVSDSFEHFRSEMENKDDFDFRFLSSGEYVTIESVQGSRVSSNIYFRVKDQTGAAFDIRFDSAGGVYDETSIHQLLSVAFSWRDPTAPVVLELGMSQIEVREMKGQPESELRLGLKTILVYSDMSFTFENDKLTDIQVR